MNLAVIGIGSNIQPDKNISEVISIIEDRFTLLKKSQFIETRAIGYKKQPDFINGAILISTELSRQELKKSLLKIESELGRIRTPNKYGPRTIDLDIVIWNEDVVDNDVFERDFLKDAVLELLPEFEFST